MRSNKKHFSPSWILGGSLGLARRGAVYAAGPIADTFTSGGQLTATQMNNIKNAVNDLQGNVPSTSCRTNAGAVDAAATRVGPLCVENVLRAAATWSAAVSACNTAGKRLLTPGEYIAAKTQAGAALGMNTDNTFEWVDSATSSHTASNTIPGAGAGRLMVGYMGPATAAVIGGGATTPEGTPINDGDIFFGTNAEYDFDYGIGFRCVR